MQQIYIDGGDVNDPSIESLDIRNQFYQKEYEIQKIRAFRNVWEAHESI